MVTVKALVTAFVGRPDGGEVRVEEGEDWPSDDPVVKANPHLFERPTRRGAKPADKSDG